MIFFHEVFMRLVPAAQNPQNLSRALRAPRCRHPESSPLSAADLLPPGHPDLSVLEPLLHLLSSAAIPPPARLTLFPIAVLPFHGGSQPLSSLLVPRNHTPARSLLPRLWIHPRARRGRGSRVFLATTRRPKGVEDYHVVELVREGSFGKVYKGRRKYTHQTVTAKFILKHGKSDKDIHNLRQEMKKELKTLWCASFPGTELRGLISEQWKEMG